MADTETKSHSEVLIALALTFPDDTYARAELLRLASMECRASDLTDDIAVDLEPLIALYRHHSDLEVTGAYRNAVVMPGLGRLIRSLRAREASRTVSSSPQPAQMQSHQ